MRFVILHYHFLKSAGMAIEDMLRRSFEKTMPPSTRRTATGICQPKRCSRCSMAIHI